MMIGVGSRVRLEMVTEVIAGGRSMNKMHRQIAGVIRMMLRIVAGEIRTQGMRR
jgi:hypothetical protein